MASKRRNMFHKNKTQETTEEGGGVEGATSVGVLDWCDWVKCGRGGRPSGGWEEVGAATSGGAGGPADSPMEPLPDSSQLCLHDLVSGTHQELQPLHHHDSGAAAVAAAAAAAAGMLLHPDTHHHPVPCSPTVIHHEPLEKLKRGKPLYA
ncbi:hypothetical protein AAG570_004025 [Ranatra chinensis]|uniref:Uncharacterized protein n=1 Tax=Ranatra chinensis TaxID=642074 RepID=A0ABD0YR56_9HEMI